MSDQAATWRGSLNLRAGRMTYRGPLGSTQLHAHHAVQVITAEQPFDLFDGTDHRTRTTHAVVPADAAHRLEATGQPATITYLDPAAATWTGTPAPRPADDLVDDAMRAVRRTLPDTVRLTDIASSIGSSSSRLTHRFTTAAGIPFSRWVLWERIQLAGRAVADGANLTAAAHAAGFADSAHLHRTFRRMFGVAPSDVAGAVDWHVDP